MKAFAVARDDAPTLEMIEVEAPTPRPDEAVIAVNAFSVNRGETFLLERERAGWRPGKDISGTVVAASADGSGPIVGARVERDRGPARPASARPCRARAQQPELMEPTDKELR
jgi:NADPH:quinone reductase